MLTKLVKIETETFMPVSRQTELFLLSVLLGAAFGVIYDVFRALRVVFPVLGKKLPTALCDILYFLICGVGIYLFSLIAARGEVRGYYWLGAFLGAVMYLLTAGTVVIGVIRAVFGTVYGAFKRIFTAISKPFISLFRKIFTKKDFKFVINDKKTSPNCKNRKNT